VRLLVDGRRLVLRVLLYQFTHDEDLLNIELGTMPGLIGDVTVMANDKQVRQLQERMLDLLRRYRDGELNFDPPPTGLTLPATYLTALAAGVLVSSALVLVVAGRLAARAGLRQLRDL